MKSTQPRRKATVRICNDSPEEIDEACISLGRAVLAATDSDGYWPNRITAAFTKAGFAVHRLQREPHHAVWLVWLDVGSVGLPADKKVAAKQIRKLVAKAGLRIKPDELTLLERRDDKAKCVFLYGSILPEVDLIGI